MNGEYCEYRTRHIEEIGYFFVSSCGTVLMDLLDSFRFCPFCGKKLIRLVYEEKLDGNKSS